MNNQNVSYDGTNKSAAGHAQNIEYWNFPAVEAKEQALAIASDEAIEFHKSLSCEIECDATSLTPEQWLARRKNTIGGSECSAVFGVNKYKNNLQLFYEKTGATKITEETESSSSELNKLWGHICEEYAAAYLQAKYPYNKIVADTNIYRLKDKPYITANIDRMMQKPDGSWVLVEIKTAGYASKEEWENGNIPMPYVYQVKQYMAILGVWEAVVMCVFSRDDIIVNKVRRDLDDEMRIIEGISDFWENNVQRGIAPTPNGSSETIISAKKQYEWGGYSPNTLVFDSSVLPKLQHYLLLQEEKKKLEKEIDAIEEDCELIKVELIDELCGNEEGQLKDELSDCMFTVKYGVRKSADRADLQKLKTLYPKAYSEVLIPGKESRTFSLKKKALKTKK